MSGFPTRLGRAWARLIHVGWTVVLTLHAVGAAAWWWLTPGGFPLSHPRFWVNRVFPLIIFLAAITARLAPRRFKSIESLRIAILAGFPMLWIVASTSSVIKFPDTFAELWLIPAALGMLFAVMWQSERRRCGQPMGWFGTIILPMAYLIGAAFPPSQHAPPPSVRPLQDYSQVAPRSGPPPRNTPSALTPQPGTRVDLTRGVVTVAHGNIVMGIEPILTFHDSSPDGCWSLLGTRQGYPTPRRFLGQSNRTGQTPTYAFSDQQTMSSLRVDPIDSNSAWIFAVTAVNGINWSHLNTFTELSIAGHKQLFIEFSPCPGERIEVRKSDYPFGRPARFAYFDDNDRFHVVEAKNAEKGPFTKLATGPMHRTQPLTITFYDVQTPVLSVTLDDWAMQCSTELSPTAGWGVPMNSIEFSLNADAANSAASVFITLAATSVGRGYDTVGHSQGNYHNRVLVKRLGAPAATRSGNS
jgi:hypothetical protein